jgi:tRNA U34 5-carboxymethylaminomethyl modifying enzyme MnmG/GidA
MRLRKIRHAADPRIQLAQPAEPSGNRLRWSDRSDRRREDPQVAEQVEIKTKYAGYIDRQQDEIARLRASEDTKLPVDIDYTNISGLSKEIQSKLGATRPETWARPRVFRASPRQRFRC